MSYYMTLAPGCQEFESNFTKRIGNKWYIHGQKAMRAEVKSGSKPTIPYSKEPPTVALLFAHSVTSCRFVNDVLQRDKRRKDLFGRAPV